MELIHINGEGLYFDHIPNKCPYCHTSIRPILRFQYSNPVSGLSEIFMTCPFISCKKGFIAYFNHQNGGGYFDTNETSKGTIIKKDFSENILRVSPDFSLIYNQSLAAEQEGLLEVCGVGYRKALEFLIKDYAVINYPNKRDEIQKKVLSQVIKENVSDQRIKTVAQRAAWLGNDETHYIRKWESKSLSDLKILIDLTLHWIEMEALTNTFEEQMPK